MGLKLNILELMLGSFSAKNFKAKIINKCRWNTKSQSELYPIFFRSIGKYLFLLPCLEDNCQASPTDVHGNQFKYPSVKEMDIICFNPELYYIFRLIKTDHLEIIFICLFQNHMHFASMPLSG